MANWVTVADASEIGENACKAIEVDEVSIVLINKGGTLYALHNVCSHMDYPLHEGEIEGDVITCALHGAKFDIATGAVRAMPAAKGVRTFPVRVEGGEIQIDQDAVAEM